MPTFVSWNQSIWQGVNFLLFSYFFKIFLFLLQNSYFFLSFHLCGIKLIDICRSALTCRYMLLKTKLSPPQGSSNSILHYKSFKPLLYLVLHYSVLIVHVFLNVGFYWLKGGCSCTVVKISTGLRALNKGYIWPLDFLAEGPDSLPEFPK